MPDRFYLSHYKLDPEREVLFKDLGSILRIAGLVFQGEGSTAILMTPSSEVPDILDIAYNQDPSTPLPSASCVIAQPSREQWAAILKQSDDPEILVKDGLEKVFHRKTRFVISGMTQQKVWARDGFCCVYCLRRMGDVQLSVDHFVPLELGGENADTNYVSACRRCNKDKGMMDPRKFCALKGYDYDRVKAGLEEHNRRAFGVGG